MDKMGKRIKLKRESLGLQMNELSSKIGVTPSLISQIEKGKAFPSIVTLKKVAEALETTVGELIGENEKEKIESLITKKERRLAKDNQNGTQSFLVSNHISGKQMEPYIISFKSNSDSREIMTTNFPGEEFCHVIKGKFEVTINDKKYILNKEDSFYFDSHKPHLFKNISKTDGELLWVITPYIN